MINSVNIIGDKCPPWNTPDGHEKIVDLMPKIFTYCCPLPKKDINHDNIDISVLLISKQFQLNSEFASTVFTNEFEIRH